MSSSSNTKKRRREASTSEELVTRIRNTRSKSKRRKSITLPSWKGPRIKTRIKPDRIKRRLAFLVVTGQSDAKIRKQLGITQSSLEQYLEIPEIQDAINAMTERVFTAGERAYQHLFVSSVVEMGELLSSKDTGVDNKLKAIDMIWRSHGRLLSGKAQAEVNLYNQTQNNAVALSGGDIERDDASNIMKLLQAMKKDNPAQEISGSEV